MNPFYPWGKPEHKRSKSDSGHTYAYGFPGYSPYHTPIYTTTPLPGPHLQVPTHYLAPSSPPWASPQLHGHSPPHHGSPLPPAGWDPAYAYSGGYAYGTPYAAPRGMRAESPTPPTPVIGELLSTGPSYRHIIYDVRSPPAEAQYHSYPNTVSLPSQARNELATTPPLRHMTLLCKRLPWKIEVNNPSGVTYGDILDHLFVNLQSAMTYGEWWIADDKKRNKVMEDVRSGKPGKTRREADGTHKVKKVDWLSEYTFLYGLEKDQKLMDERFIPDSARDETWTVVLTKPPSDGDD